MFARLVSRNEDLRRLVEKGYAVAFDTNHLIVRDIPYLDTELNLRRGAIVSKLEFIDQERVRQVDHQIYFAGAAPYGLDGKPIPNLGGGPCSVALSAASADVVVERSFSNKPASGSFADHFDKVESYVAIISGPAIARHGEDVAPLTFRSVEAVPDDSIFKVQDTLTSRAEITDLVATFHDDVVAVIGLGGTGAYLLDFVAKTPVREIRAFDGDTFHVHTAFRSPGRLEAGEFGQSKAAVYQARYDSLRRGLRAEDHYVEASRSADLDGVTFAFICVDKGPARAEIIEMLLQRRIPFIDVGMGLGRGDHGIGGMARITYFPAERGDEIRSQELVPLADDPDDIYRTAIQIAELNALNACLAVIRFKQLRGLYQEAIAWDHLVFDVGDMTTAGLSPSAAA